MLKEKIGIVTEEEKLEIEKLFQRTNALQELIAALDNLSLTSEKKDSVYEKIINDISESRMNQEKWWRKTSEKYQWESKENTRWVIDFERNEIYLVDNTCSHC